MPELHWHPFLEEWVVITPDRQGRPNLPKNSCPFCPGSPQVPDQYDAFAYPNDFPSLSFTPGTPASAGGLYRAAPAVGTCEVLLYSSDHRQSMATLRPEQMDKVIELWASRWTELSARPDVEYVFIFENRGDSVGATIPHPHGQLYAFGFVPPHFQQEADAQARYRQRKGRCLGCSLAAAESGHPQRLVKDTATLIATVPYYCRYPFEVQVLPKRHVGALPEFSAEERRDLNVILRDLAGRYERLFGRSIPTMMWQHARPVRADRDACHFRISFMTNMRAADKQKFFASVESAAGTFLSDQSPEAMAEQLRKAGA